MSLDAFIVPSVFTGRFFKDNPKYGAVILVYFCLLVTMIVLYLLGVPSYWILGFFGLMILLAVAAMITTKGRISMYELDDRPITIGGSAIQVGNEEYPFSEIKKMSIYIHSYYNQRYEEMWNGGSSYGMDNRIYFETATKKFEFRFIIPDEKSFVALYWVLDDWDHAGIRYGLKEEYGRNYIFQLKNKYSR